MEIRATDIFIIPTIKSTTDNKYYNNQGNK